MCSNELTLGDRTYLSVSHTRAKINVNTNLGIILLCCPIIHSIINYNQLELCDAIKSSLEDSSSNDTRKICKSISIVMPGGLGTSEKMDVNSNPDVSILEIMKYSSNYDRIAYQYANNFDDIFNFIVPLIIRRVESLKSLDFALSMVFLEVLASIPDSHISRKFGHKIAKKTSNQANDLLKIIDRDLSQDKAYIKILQLDDEYKKKGLNPGTSADLLVASLFVYKHFYDYTASST